MEIETKDEISERAISKENPPLENPKDFDDNNTDTINNNGSNNGETDNINNNKDNEFRISINSYTNSF